MAPKIDYTASSPQFSGYLGQVAKNRCIDGNPHLVAVAIVFGKKVESDSKKLLPAPLHFSCIGGSRDDVPTDQYEAAYAMACRGLEQGPGMHKDANESVGCFVIDDGDLAIACVTRPGETVSPQEIARGVFSYFALSGPQAPVYRFLTQLRLAP